MGAPFNQYIRYLAQTRLAEQEAQRQQALLDRTREYVGGLLGQEQQMAPAGSQAEFQAFNQIPFEAAGQMTPEQQVMTQQGKGLIGGEMSQPEFFAGLLSAPTQQAQELGAQGLLSMMAPQSNSLPANVQEYMYWSSLSPQEQQRYLTVKRAQKYLDTGGQYVAPDPRNPTRTQPVIDKELPPEQRPETKAAQTTAVEQAKKRQQLPKARASVRAMQDKMDLLRDKVAEGLYLADGTTTGIGSWASWVPGTDAKRLAGVVDTIIANLGFNELQSMRANSPTGGALGQVSERELALLTSAKQKIDQAQSPQDFRDALLEVLDIANRMAQSSITAFEEDFGVKYNPGQKKTNRSPSANNAPPPPPGFNRKVNP